MALSGWTCWQYFWGGPAKWRAHTVLGEGGLASGGTDSAGRDRFCPILSTECCTVQDTQGGINCVFAIVCFFPSHFLSKHKETIDQTECLCYIVSARHRVVLLFSWMSHCSTKLYALLGQYNNESQEHVFFRNVT